MPAPRSEPDPNDPWALRSQRPRYPVLAAGGALALHARLVARDEQALADLIEVATPWLLAVAQAMLADADEAEEVVQEAFTIVWNRVGQVSDDPRGFMAWVLRIARNRAIDRLRSRKRWLRKSAHLAAHGVVGELLVDAVEPNEAGTPGWQVHRE